MIAEAYNAERTVPVAEIFGPTIQGEGPLAGLPCSFVRFGGCDYKCTWCDSPHAVLPEKVRKLEKYSLLTIAAALDNTRKEQHPKWAVFSGGNPAMHELGKLVQMLHDREWLVQVETQGTLFKSWLTGVDRLVISPKPPSASQHSKHTLAEFIKQYNELEKLRGHQAALKVVVFNEGDLDYASSVRKAYPAVPFFLSCGTVPQEAIDQEGTYSIAKFASDRQPDTLNRTAQRYQWLCEEALKRPEFASTRIYPQLHNIAWGHDRGH